MTAHVAQSSEILNEVLGVLVAEPSGPLFSFLSGQLPIGLIYSKRLLRGKPCIWNKNGQLRKCPSFTKPGSDGIVLSAVQMACVCVNSDRSPEIRWIRTSQGYLTSS